MADIEEAHQKQQFLPQALDVILQLLFLHLPLGLVHLTAQVAVHARRVARRVQQQDAQLIQAPGTNTWKYSHDHKYKVIKIRLLRTEGSYVFFVDFFPEIWQSYFKDVIISVTTEIWHVK